MATFLDVSGLASFGSIFVFLFVWLVVYALALYIKAFGSNKAIAIIIGLIIAIFVVLSPVATVIVQYVSPWFAVLFIFAMLSSMLIQSFGGGTAEGFESLKWLVIVVIIITFLVAIFGYLGQASSTAPRTPMDYTKASTVLLHPKFLGMLVVLIIAIFTITLLVGKTQ